VGRATWVTGLAAHWGLDMAAVFRVVGAIVAALLAALVLVIAVEMFSSVVHPLPADFGGTTEEMCAHVERYPAWVLALVVPMWAGAALAGTWIAGWLGNRAAALFVGLLLLLGAVSNIAMLPYPAWFKVSCPTVIAIAIVAGVYWSGRRTMAAVGSTN
jgi:hypothetical protein